MSSQPEASAAAVALQGAEHSLTAELAPSYRFHHERLMIDGVPFDMGRYPFLIELYDEAHPHIVIRKAAQLGLTSWAVIMVIERMRSLYRRGVLYTFPTDDEVYDFSQARFERLIRENKMFEGLVETTDRVVLKKVREGRLYFRGMRSTSKLLSIPVDLIVFDEYSQMDPMQTQIAMERLSGSDFRHWIKLGHPTLPGYMIDEEWQNSDQRHWMIRCEFCGTHTCLELSFPDCLARSTDGEIYRACDKCRREIRVFDGEWVPAKRAGPDVPRGYWMSQLMSPTVPPSLIQAKFDDASVTGQGLQIFYNMTLGTPFANIDDSMTAKQVMDVCDPNRVAVSADPGPCFLGCDVGKEHLFVCIGRRPHGDALEVLHWSKIETFDELFDLGQRFHVQSGVIDMGAEARNVREFLQRARWAYGCHYTTSRQPYRWDFKRKTVNVNRTESLDASHQAIALGRASFPRASPFFEKVIVPQIINLVRVLNEDPRTGAKKPAWIVRGKKNDDFRHAWNYAVLASERCGAVRDRLQRGQARGGERRGWQAV